MNVAVDEFGREAERVERARQAAIRDGNTNRLREINQALIEVERQFIDARGLKGRAWYKHQIYAPGFYTGYAAQPLTDFRQAIDERNGANAKPALERIVDAVRRASQVLKQARD
jgi:N-acetylated-alpha-linked acidic dipeptidase